MRAPNGVARLRGSLPGYERNPIRHQIIRLRRLRLSECNGAPLLSAAWSATFDRNGLMGNFGCSLIEQGHEHRAALLTASTRAIANPRAHRKTLKAGDAAQPGRRATKHPNWSPRVPSRSQQKETGLEYLLLKPPEPLRACTLTELHPLHSLRGRMRNRRGRGRVIVALRSRRSRLLRRNGRQCTAWAGRTSHIIAPHSRSLRFVQDGPELDALCC